MTEPLRRRSTPVRLWAAAALSVLPLGLVWSAGVTPGIVLYGDCGYTDAGYCVPDQFVPGSVYTSLVGQSPIRVFLAFAGLVFVYCATRPRTDATRALARVACGGLVVAAALAAAHHSPRVLLCLAGALALVVPLVAPRASGTTGFGVRAPRRVK